MKYLHQVSYLRLQDVIGVCLSYYCLSGTTCVLVLYDNTILLHSTALFCIILGRSNGTIAAAIQTFPCMRHGPSFCLGVAVLC